MNNLNYISNEKLNFFDKQTPKCSADGFSSFAITVYLGECNSGKTYNCVKHILEQCRKGQVKKVAVLSPTYDINPIWKLLEPYTIHSSSNIDNAVEFVKECEEIGQLEYELWHALHVDYSQDKFDTLLNHIAFYAKTEALHPGFLTKLDRYVLKFSHGDAKWFKDPPCLALIVDDCQGSPLFGGNSYFSNFILRHRHRGMDVHILLQHFVRSISGTIKGIVNRWFIWGLKSDKDIYDLYRLTSARYCDFETFKNVMKLMTFNEEKNKNESFIITDNKSAKNRFRLGFNLSTDNLVNIESYLLNGSNKTENIKEPPRKKIKTKTSKEQFEEERFVIEPRK